MKPVSSKLLYGHICQLVMDISPTISCTITSFWASAKNLINLSIPTENKSIISFAQILHSVLDDRTVSFYQILYYACGFVQDDRKKLCLTGILQCQRSTNTVFLYYSQNQCITGKACSWTSLQNTDYEQETFVSHCIPAS